MKIGFISDTHGGYEEFLKGLDIFGDIDYIVHTGDVLGYGMSGECPLSFHIKGMSNIYIVRGNGDYYDSEKILDRKLEYQKGYNFKKDGVSVRILASHSHKEGVYSLINKGIYENYDILAYGHSHVKHLEKINNLIVINPGSPTLPRDYVASVGLLDTKINKIMLIRLSDKSIIKQIKYKDTL